VDLKQHLDVLDYFGGLAVCCAFFAIIFIISNTCIRLCCISKEEKVTSTPFSQIRRSQPYRTLVSYHRRFSLKRDPPKQQNSDGCLVVVTAEN
uniref:FXYD domain-containing ion transport regulator n=1 Tax=Haemonchus contortus TaxID=6289 RepID=A0A7I4YXA5_HAECO